MGNQYLSLQLDTDLFTVAQTRRKHRFFFSLVKNLAFCVLADARTWGSFLCPDILHCSNLPSSAAPLHRAAPHNAQMVAIVLPRLLPRRIEQEALLCVPEGQEAWLTDAEPT